MRLLVIEDGNEYEEFVRVFLGSELEILHAHTAQEALILGPEADALLVDLRFERTPPEQLIGDLGEVARLRFCGDEDRALSHLREHQGLFILERLRRAGVRGRAVFVHDFSASRLANLQRLYGDVAAVSSFDAVALRAAILEAPRCLP